MSNRDAGLDADASLGESRHRRGTAQTDERLAAVRSTVDIPPHYRNTPIGRLLRYHNLRYASSEAHRSAELLIGMCMDNRTSLRIPNRFAFTIRTAGANLRDNEFRIAFAIAVGGVTALAIIGHSDCAMSGLADRRVTFVRGMVDRAGWDEGLAAEFFDRNVSRFEIGDEVEFAVREARRIRPLYPRLLVAPLLYDVDDEMLYLIREDAVAGGG